MFQVRKHNLISVLVADPYRGDTLRRLTKNDRILLPADEIEPCIDFFYRLSLGDGATKLVHRLSEHYIGISKNRIVSFLNTHPVHSKLNPSFKNKAPLQPIITQQIMERHQIDLVSFEKNSVKRDEASTLELPCEHLLIYIFAFATMYCDQTTSNISAVCRRFNSLVKTQQFQDKQFQEHWLSTVADWSTKSKAYREEFLYSRKSAVVYMLCPKCGDENHSHSGWQRGPNGLATLFASDGVCNALHTCELYQYSRSMKLLHGTIYGHPRF